MGQSEVTIIDRGVLYLECSLYLVVVAMTGPEHLEDPRLQWGEGESVCDNQKRLFTKRGNGVKREEEGDKRMRKEGRK
jgi:hypothetical protein